ncbi:hypothetical protein ACFP51_32715 [Streptomyces pratens]
MVEHQIERAYRDRFTRAQHAQDETDRLLTHTLENILAEQAELSAWFVAVARPDGRYPAPCHPLSGRKPSTSARSHAPAPSA